MHLQKTKQNAQQFPERIGSYVVQRILGQGGMGVVYEVLDPKTKIQYALKTLQGFQEKALFHFRREIYTLSQLKHPGIVKIFSEGVEKGLPWYTMELVQGKTLRQFCQKTTLLSCLEIIDQLTDVLSFLHGEGLVHCDIKPQNILVRTSSNTPVLVDFGLTSQFQGYDSREILDIIGGTVGTLAYMSPEQILGQTIDARADLYSLGCVLYEIATGTPPFQGDTLSQVVRGHLYKPPVPPIKINDTIHPVFNELIIKLLAKNPKERPGHAADIRVFLRKIGIKEKARPLPSVHYLYRPGFSGRKNILTLLEKKLSKLFEGEGNFVLLGGESGIGKTRVAMEFSKIIEPQNLSLYIGDCVARTYQYPGQGKEGGVPLFPLKPFLQAIGDRCHEFGTEETETLLGNRAKLLSLYEPSLKNLPGQEKYPAPPKLPLAESQARLFRYLYETFIALSRQSPFVLLLDDLQWADKLTLDFLEFFLQKKYWNKHSILLLATYRQEEYSLRLQTLINTPGVSHILLPRLDQNATRSIIEDMLALTPPEALVQYLFQQSEGNPLFLAEYLKTALEEGFLQREPGSVWKVSAKETTYQNLSVPKTLQELLETRIKRLSSPAQFLLKIAAVLGREFEIELLEKLWSTLKKENLLNALSELIRRQFLEELPTGKIQFLHDKIREVSYQQIPVSQKKTLHKNAAKLLEQYLTGALDEFREQLGDHWKLGGQIRLAKTHYLQGAQYEEKRYAHAASENLYRAYLALVKKPSKKSVEARIELAKNVLLLQGKNPEAKKELNRARKEAKIINNLLLEATAIEGLAEVAKNVSQLEKSCQYWQEALGIYQRLQKKKAEAMLLGNLAFSLNQLGKSEQAKEACQHALNLLKPCNAPREKAGVLRNLGAICWTRGDFDEGFLCYEKSLSLCQKTRDRVSEGIVLGNLAGMSHGVGRFAEADRFWKRSIAIHREVGNRRLEGMSLGNQATSLHFRIRLIDDDDTIFDCLEKAQELFEQALEIHRETANQKSEVIMITRLAGIHAEYGRLEKARVLYQDSIALLEKLHNYLHLSPVLRAYAILERRIAGDLSKAIQLMEKADTYQKENHNKVDYALALCEKGHLQLAQGNDASLLLPMIENAVKETGVSENSELGLRFQYFQKALEAFRDGKPLFRGELIEAFPPTLAPWLKKTHNLVG